jgi:hypothetical protein
VTKVTPKKRARRVFINVVYAQAIKRAWRVSEQGKNKERNERDKKEIGNATSDVRVTW